MAMRNVKIVLLLVAAVSMSANRVVAKSRWIEKPQWQRHFQEAKVNGSFLLLDWKNNRYLVFNRKRANTRYLPASTFKILNSLVALETQAVRDENEILRWDGVDKGLAAWNRDHSMKSAIQSSAVWFYQEMARRIGQNRMQRFVRAARYGNQNIGGGIDRFWLDGGLRISSQEQIRFLVKLHENKLPFSRRSHDIVKSILVQPDESNGKNVLRAKTGLAGVALGLPSGAAPVDPKVGWWIGYVERPDNAYFFAINIDIAKESDSASRMSVTKSILREMKVID